MKAVALAIAIVAAGCATFEDPTIVLDLRIVGIVAQPPEQVVEIDLAAPPNPLELVGQLGPTRVCATISDPGAARGVRWSMTACQANDEGRCDADRPQIFLGEGPLADPETTPLGGLACSLIEYDVDPGAWVALFLDALERDPTRGLGGIDYAVELRASGEDGVGPAVVGVKQMRVSARVPDDKVANRNPYFLDLQLSRNGSAGTPSPREHCADAPEVEFDARAGDIVTLYPVEPPEDAQQPAREEFVVPTLDGGFEKYTESLSYQWLGVAGEFADAMTGGPPDLFGNETLLGTDWTAPGVERVTDIQLWVIQRDERFGVSVREICITVSP